MQWLFLPCQCGVRGTGVHSTVVLFLCPWGRGDALMLCEYGGVGVGYGLSAMSLGHGGC